MPSTYTNPVYQQSCPDPFVLKYCGVYWAYCTGIAHDGRWFGVLRSRDLAHWEQLDGAMKPLPGDWPCLWAPEVTYHNGSFYLYYSLGDEATMHVRVARAATPAGPFIDCGQPLTHEPFAIDPHVFVDEDGSRHLFYATDYLEHSHVGTGTARVRLTNPLTPVGAPVPVTRPRYDWQLYDPHREAKGGVRWHTVEGPFVLKRKGRYYQMFSGGNWQNPSYGVSYAIAEQLDSDEEWSQVADGAKVLPILRSVPGAVIGPGHNSVVRGPTNLELFCVYHRWADDASARLMALDRLDWAGERMLLLGPTTTPQPIRLPTLADFFDDPRPADLGPRWVCTGGAWATDNGEATQTAQAVATAVCVADAHNYVAEVSARAIAIADDASYGVALGEYVCFLLQPGRGRIVAATRQGDGWAAADLALPTDFAAQAFHLLRVERNAGRVAISLDEGAPWQAYVPADVALPFALRTDNATAAFAGFALTSGWADLFYPGAGPAEDWGWHGHGWSVANGELRAPVGAAPVLKGPLPPAYELVVNARLGDQGRYGFYPTATADALGPLVCVERRAAGWALCVYAAEQRHAFALPASFDPTRTQQLRAVVRGGSMQLSWEGLELGAHPVPTDATMLGLWAEGGAAFELVRVTAVL